MWIERDISEKLQENVDPIQIVRGPRQCGKSSLILHLDPSFKELSLDDPSLRELAQSDPELFLKQFDSQKLFIDEAQYAPALFPSLKRRADLLKRSRPDEVHTIFRLTGSNQILMDRNVKESLAGRVSFFDMNTLSVSEILAARETSIQSILYAGGWPEIHARDVQNPKKFLDDYINSYIEKDVVLAAGIQKSREFLKFIQLLAGRVGELLDYSSLGNDSGVDSKTIKDWISVLERMHIIALVQPFSSNLSSRLTKSPKVYFIDTGLACRLQGWTSPEPILTSLQQGHLFENLVFSEIFKTNLNGQLDWKIYHWRSKDGEEVDFLIQKDPSTFFFVESKVSPTGLKSPADMREVKKVFRDRIPPFILCHQEGEHALGNRVPIRMLKNTLMSALKD
jgi:uncharacterized protein